MVTMAVPLRVMPVKRDVVCIDSEPETSLTVVSDVTVLTEPEAILDQIGLTSETVVVGKPWLETRDKFCPETTMLDVVCPEDIDKADDGIAEVKSDTSELEEP